jgi:phosphoesterase RecJ-like protein
MKVPEKLIQALLSNRHFTIASHISPEGDAIGSAIALALVLKRLDKDVSVYIRDGVPEIYRFMPHYEIVESTLDMDSLEERILIIVDCNEPKRIGVEGELKCKTSIVIDHHETRKDYGDIKWIEPTSSATGLMIYYLIKELKVEITPDIATNLYVAIAEDTGTFRYGNTTSEVFRVAAELVDRGASPGWVAINLYESWSTKRFNLLREMLNTLQIYNSGPLKVAITVITEDMFKKTGTDASDTEDFSNIPRILKEVDVSVLLRQDGPNKWKASMRSKGDVNVATVAKEFGGGGHKNAAGFITQGDLEEIKAEVIEKIKRLGNN